MAFPRRSIGITTAGLALVGAAYLTRRMMVRRSRPLAASQRANISGVVHRTPDQVVDVPDSGPFH